MIYQEINLPIWAQLLIMAILILIGIELVKHAQTTSKSDMELTFNLEDVITIKET